MPAKQVRSVFQELFQTQKFVINQNTMFELGESNPSVFKSKVKNLRGLARFLASADHFKGRTFYSISKVFNVSVGAMAIRLEELDLIEF